MNIPFFNAYQQRAFDCCLLFGLLGYGAYVLIKEVIQDSAD
ncbi:hypothetical protein [Helicobacter bizzozeronii]|nr:hypothetical protein [Helicobacter bizzozeronii]